MFQLFSSLNDTLPVTEVTDVCGLWPRGTNLLILSKTLGLYHHELLVGINSHCCPYFSHLCLKAFWNLWACSTNQTLWSTYSTSNINSHHDFHRQLLSSQLWMRCFTTANYGGKHLRREQNAQLHFIMQNTRDGQIETTFFQHIIHRPNSSFSNSREAYLVED